MPVAFGLAFALLAGGFALAGGAQQGAPARASASTGPELASSGMAVSLIGNVNPNRVPQQRFVNAMLRTSVGHDNADGSPGVPTPTKALRIDFGNNVRFRPNRPPRCTANIEGTTTEQARALCPNRSIIGDGTAHVRVPGPLTFTDLTTLAIAGPERRQIRFHAYSPTLGSSATQVIQGMLSRNAPGQRYDWQLRVPNVPEILGGTGANILFGVRLRRPTGVVQARCLRPQRFFWRAFWTFTDDTTERAVINQRCIRR